MINSRSNFLSTVGGEKLTNCVGPTQTVGIGYTCSLTVNTRDSYGRPYIESYIYTTLLFLQTILRKLNTA